MISTIKMFKVCYLTELEQQMNTSTLEPPLAVIKDSIILKMSSSTSTYGMA